MNKNKDEQTHIQRPAFTDTIVEYITKNMSTLAYPQLFPRGENCVFDDINGLD
jgi:hypothetical protein